MDTIKKSWITEGLAEGLYSITLESNKPDLEHERIRVSELSFPKEPSEKHPLRHTVNIGLLTEQDLINLWITIGKHLDAL